MRQAILDEIKPPYPLKISGTVVHGFGRGGKELGCPTANLDNNAMDHMPVGIYYGWAKLNEKWYKQVMSAGYNPQYGNTKRSIEVHLISQLDDFYGAHMDVIVCGFLRNEKQYDSLETLIEDIKLDIKLASEALDFKSHNLDTLIHSN